MTAYGDRRRAGYYQVGTIQTKVQNAPAAAPPQAAPTPQAAPKPEPEAAPTIDPDTTTLAELQAQAEALGLPTYGSKPMLAERIAKHQTLTDNLT